MAPQYYGRRQEAKSCRIEQAAARLPRHHHAAILPHGQLDDVAIAAEPAARRLEIGRIDEQRQGRRRPCRLRSDARFRHRARPELAARARPARPAATAAMSHPGATLIFTRRYPRWTAS